MRVAWWSLTAVLGLLRVCLLSILTVSGGLVYLLFGLADCVEFALGTWNAARAKVRHYSWSSLTVPTLYLVGLVLLPALKGVTFAGLSALLVLLGPLLSAVSLFHLRGSFTYGATSWVSLRDRGLYGLIRHPQQAGRLLFCVGVWLATNKIQALACGLLGALVAICEERDLIAYPEYAEYRRRVRWMFIPGVV